MVFTELYAAIRCYTCRIRIRDNGFCRFIVWRRGCWVKSEFALLVGVPVFSTVQVPRLFLDLLLCHRCALSEPGGEWQ